MSLPLRYKQLLSTDALSILRQVEGADSKTILASVHDTRMGIKIGIVTFLLSATYAVIRYHVIKGVSWSDLPVFTLNKVFGVSSLLLLVISTIRYRLRPALSNSKILYLSGLYGGVHILLSCMLLDPAYYEKFFYHGKLTAMAGLSMLSGAVAGVLFISKANVKKGRPILQITGGLAVVCSITGLHVAFQGYQSWLTPYDWPGFIPPLTLISFLTCVVAAAMTIHRKQ